MMAKMKMGPKGQVVIPKMFRDDYGLMPGHEVVMDDTGEGILIKKPASNIAELARLIAKSGKKVKITTELLKQLDEEELEDRHGRLR